MTKGHNILQLALESRRTNFILGESNPDFNSVSSTTYITHELDGKNKIEQKKLAKDLRSHHFSYGNEEHKHNLTTINRDDYKDLPISEAKPDNQSYLRANHFSVGDVSDKSNIYNTTYNNSVGMLKDLPPRHKLTNESFKTTYLLKINEKPDFLTESRVKYCIYITIVLRRRHLPFLRKKSST